jgi:peptidoglycan-N-acetylglucosamine deacetylase
LEESYLKKFALFIALLISIGSGSYLAYRNAIIKQSKSEVSQKPSSASKQPEPQSVPVEPKKLIIYDILGRSNKLGPKAWKSMQDWRSSIVQVAKDNPDMVYINGKPEEKVCALTFDDGPDNIIMPKILSVLKGNHVNASFFLIGNKVKEFSSVVKAASDDGNLVLNHSYSHPELSKLNEESIKKQIELTENNIYEVTGKRPKIIRPSYGDLNDTVISAAKDEGYKIVIWSIDTLDWSQKEKSNIIKNVEYNVRPGEIILMHCDGDKAATLAALPQIISDLKERGYKFVTLDKLLGIDAYK